MTSLRTSAWEAHAVFARWLRSLGSPAAVSGNEPAFIGKACQSPSKKEIEGSVNDNCRLLTLSAQLGQFEHFHAKPSQDV